jgi:hypothetical protein
MDSDLLITEEAIESPIVSEDRRNMSGTRTKTTWSTHSIIQSSCLRREWDFPERLVGASVLSLCLADEKSELLTENCVFCLNGQYLPIQKRDCVLQIGTLLRQFAHDFALADPPLATPKRNGVARFENWIQEPKSRVRNRPS